MTTRADSGGVVKGRSLAGRELSGAPPSAQIKPAAVFDGERLAALRDTALIEGQPDDAFARLNRLAVELLGVPVSLVSLVGEDRQFFAGQVGLPEPWASFRETPLSHSFCQHVVNSGEPLVIDDARSDPLVSDNLAIRDLGVAAYAGMPLRMRDGNVLGSFCAIDASPRHWSERDLRILGDLASTATDLIELHRVQRVPALHDPLTGLPDRALFAELVARSVTHAGRSRECAAVLALGIDGFRLVNEALGHAGGDKVLVTVGQRLTVALGGGNSVCRVAGDEFLVLCESACDEADALVLAGRLREAVFGDPIDIEGRDQSIAATIGVACTTSEVEPAELIDAALAGLHRAKAGAHACERVDPARRERADNRLRLRSDIAGAHERGELHLAYQPIMQLNTGQPAGVEALLRWRHPDLGLIPPNEFIPGAEKSGAVVALGEWVLRQACSDLLIWRRRWPERNLTVAVNVAPVQMGTANFVDVLSSTLDDLGMSPSALTLEITERTLLHDGENHRRIMDGLRALGIRFALDDFGTGYSALGYLTRFPIEIVKIDRTFIDAMSTDPRAARLVEGILAMTSGLGLQTVAEGIESKDQLDTLTRMGCQFGQGYLLGRPVAATTMTQKLAGD
jgi:diguanylate cyclase (GGDEF)-like protein